VKTSVLCILFAVMLHVPAMRAEALPLEQTKALLSAPMLIEHGRSSRMHVVFRHDQHVRQVRCRACHHEKSPEQSIFVSCAAAASCHPNTDITNRAGKSYYLALHNPDSPRSCLGCHAAESSKRSHVARPTRLDGCQTCHSALPPTYDDAAVNR
jgi:hypothetical protein